MKDYKDKKIRGTQYGIYGIVVLRATRYQVIYIGTSFSFGDCVIQ